MTRAEREATHTFPILIIDMAMVQRPLDLLLKLRRKILKTIKHVEISIVAFPNKINDIADDLGGDASPAQKC
jgi:hypothetical protein